TVRARGDEVTFSYPRSRTKLESLATEAGGRARAWRRETRGKRMTACCWQSTGRGWMTCSARQATLSGEVILSCSLRMNAGDTELVIGHTRSGAEKLARNRYAKQGRIASRCSR